MGGRRLLLRGCCGRRRCSTACGRARKRLGRFACKGHVGAKGISLEEPDDVKEGLAAALASKSGPVVVDVVVDPFALSLSSHGPFRTAKGFTLSLAKQVLSGRMDTVIKMIERNAELV